MPILTALLVAGALYLMVFERDRLLAFARDNAIGDAGPQLAVAEDGAAPVAESDLTPAPEVIADAESDTAKGPDAQVDEGTVAVVALDSTAVPVDTAVVLRGNTEAARQVVVRAETTGLIVSDPLRKGATVEAGELLCELDPGTRQSNLEEAQGRLSEARARLPEARARIPEAEARRAEARARVTEAEARLAEARARLAEAEINENAASRLGEDGFASQTRVANATAALEAAQAGIVSAQAQVESAAATVVGAGASVEGAQAQVEGVLAQIASAEASVAAAERELERLAIRAPFGGQLETDTAELGALLQPGGECATILQLDPIVLVAFVPETEVARVTPGAVAGARLASGQELTGQVSFIARSADPQTRTFRIEIEVPNPDLGIRDGQTVEIAIQAPGAAAHLVPQSALTLDDDGALGLRVAEGGVARFYPATVLRDTREGVYVTGLPERAQVIVLGQEYVIDDVPVAVTLREDLP